MGNGQQGGSPPAWLAAHQLSREYVGGATHINRLLRRLRQGLLERARSEGRSDKEAAAHVASHWVATRPSSGGRFPEVLIASPEAVVMLGLTRRDAAPPEKPEDWRSVADLSKERGGEFYALERKLLGLRERFEGDLQAAGYPPEAASSLVDQFLIGRRKPPSSRPGLAASPDAVRAGEEAGVLKRPGRGR